MGLMGVPEMGPKLAPLASTMRQSSGMGFKPPKRHHAMRKLPAERTLQLSEKQRGEADL